MARALIGSWALKYRCPSIVSRNPKDIDIVSPYFEIKSWSKFKKFRRLEPFKEGTKMVAITENKKIYEFEIAWEKSLAEEFLILLEKDPETSTLNDSNLYEHMLFLPSLDVLYMLKLSHKHLKDSPHFLKTMLDIKAMEKMEAKVPEMWKDWFKKRKKEIYYYAHPSLKRDKEAFFNPNEGVHYVYEHDTIHLAMAHLDKPAYDYFKANDKDVSCSQDIFNTLDEKVKLYSVLEETYVLALERSQIPFGNRLTPRQSFEKALEKVCTSITSGWWREYAYNNYFKALEMYDENYVDKFYKAVESGIVKKYKEGVK